MKWIALLAWLCALLLVSASAETAIPRPPIRVDVIGTMAVLTHSDGRVDAVPCATVNVGRRAYLAKKLDLVTRASRDVSRSWLVEQVQLDRPRIAAYNEIASLCERSKLSRQDPQADDTALKLERAIERLDALMRKSGI